MDDGYICAHGRRRDQKHLGKQSTKHWNAGFLTASQPHLLMFRKRYAYEEMLYVRFRGGTPHADVQ